MRKRRGEGGEEEKKKDAENSEQKIRRGKGIETNRNSLSLGNRPPELSIPDLSD